MKKNNHDDNKMFIETLIKNVLEKFNLCNESFIKSEEPDWITNDMSVGLEVVEANETYEFDAFIQKYGNQYNDKFDEKYKALGGRIFNKDDVVVKILNLKGLPIGNKNKVYIIPVYNNDFSCINRKVMEKLLKLEHYQKLDNYQLAIFTPILLKYNDLDEELELLIKISKNFKRKYLKIFVVSLCGIVNFDILNKKRISIEVDNSIINELSIETYNQLNKNKETL